MEQRSEEWFAARVGSLGASKIADALARTKSGWGATRANVMAALIAERLTGIPHDGYVNSIMLRGIEVEPEARSAYSFYNNCDVVEVGLVRHPVIVNSHASPDGLVGDDGLVEIKSPNTSTHIEALLGASVPQKYKYQMQWQMACTGRAWCDFVSFDPRMPEELKIHICRIDRDDALIATLESEVIEFLTEVDSKLAQLRALTSGKTPLTGALEGSLASMQVN